MQKLLSISTAARPSGSPPQQRLLKVPAGVYRGRLAALYADSANNISLKVADYPYQSWSAAQVIASDAHDSPFSACIDSAGNIYLTYADTSQYLKIIKLSFNAGVWSAGSPATIVNVDLSSRPVILKDGDNTLWCFFNHHWTSNDYRHYIRVKSSTDDGQTWGSGPSDLGTALSSAWLEEGYICACRHISKLYAVYCVGRSNLILRVNDLSNPGWSAESAIATSDYIDDQFQAAPSGDGKLGVVFIPSSAERVYIKDYDGLLWSGLIEIESTEARSPQITYKDNTPHIFYTKHLGNGYHVPRYAKRSGVSFSIENLSDLLSIFDKVFLFCAAAGQQYQDRTSAAANTSTGDIFHTESQGLLDSIGDCLYLGKQVKFYCAAVILSATGSGGTVVWEYFNGSDWAEFTPYSGGYHFDSADELLYLWQDAASVPAGWQIGAVNNITAFWVRARVTNGFSSNPIGTQILAATKIDDLSLAHEEAL
jgi:hypothetical protein